MYLSPKKTYSLPIKSLIRLTLNASTGAFTSFRNEEFEKEKGFSNLANTHAYTCQQYLPEVVA